MAALSGAVRSSVRRTRAPTAVSQPLLTAILDGLRELLQLVLAESLTLSEVLGELVGLGVDGPLVGHTGTGRRIVLPCICGSLVCLMSYTSITRCMFRPS